MWSNFRSLVFSLVVLVLGPTAALALGPADLPTVTVDRDDVSIKTSCRVVVAPGVVIRDANDDGVVHVDADDVTIEFDPNSVLRGAAADASPDTYAGFGVRVSGHSGVTIRGLRASGFRAGVWATHADRLTLDRCDVSDNRRDHLRSTPQAEDERDWLWPHDNDKNEWLTKYGAGIYVEDSRGIVVHDCRARRGQNGLCLDRVEDSKIYDNDFSFLSGWGIALWRSSRNVLSRNAVDFCIRGYSHGVYNRGQDSAGFLVFEQSSNNLFVFNSATHCGDGFFGFAGKEALGENPPPTSDFSYKRRGCNDNTIASNDFSFAAAHGIELTFSFGNRLFANLCEGNAICGLWAGYSQNTVIDDGDFINNGDAAHSFERGGINIEHGRDNVIAGNRFVNNNDSGVQLWWDEDAALASRPWVKANGAESTGNLITGNSFESEPLAIRLRGRGDASAGGNSMAGVEKEQQADGDAKLTTLGGTPPMPTPPNLGEQPGVKKPFGARTLLRSREHILMTEWGPWDHSSPLVRVLNNAGDKVEFELRRVPKEARIEVNGTAVERKFKANLPIETPESYAIEAPGPGVHPYTLTVRGPGIEEVRRGVLVSADWEVVVFPSPTDPRKDAAAWRKGAESDAAVRASMRSLVLRYGNGGPGDLPAFPGANARRVGVDHFGTIATTTLALSKGSWQIWTLSDDGVRVTVDERVLIENWTHHGATRDAATLTLDEPKTVHIAVEHFELDGYAVLEFGIEPASAATTAPADARPPAQGK